MTITPSNTDELLIEQRGHVVIFTLNRPRRLNAISRSMLTELSAKMVEANKDPEVRCIILTGAGKGFCSGLDLSGVDEGGIGSDADRRRRKTQLFDLREAPINVMWNIDTPIICAINGAAAGYGMDMTLLCDIRLIGESGKMAAVTAKRNVVPESGGTWLLPRLIGWGKAAELYYRARTVLAPECVKLGLANAVVPDDELMDTALQWANEIAENAPVSVQTTKRMMRMGLEESYDTAVDHLMMHLARMFQMDDFQEGVRAFKEKRKPEFKGF